MTYNISQNPRLFSPLSSNQSNLWLIHQLAPNSSAHNVYSATSIVGNVDVHTWSTSWNHLAARHPIMRTTYQTRNTQPVQVLHQFPKIELEVVNLTCHTESSIKRRIVEDSQRPFDLEQGPVFRAFLYKKSPKQHIQLIVIPEISGELRSLGILLNEFFSLYFQTLESRTKTVELLTR